MALSSGHGFTDSDQPDNAYLNVCPDEARLMSLVF